MRSVEEQLAVISAAAVPPEPVRIAISESLGLRCAEQVEGTRAVPGFDQAAIDGYAVRAVDVRGVAEGEIIQLPVVGEVTAGSSRPVRLQPKQAVRVHEGAPIPTLADAILPLDWADVDGRHIEALRAVRSGEFLHRLGSDVQPGDVVVEQGAVIGAAQVGLLAAIGRSKVLVYPKPRLSIMSFGPELVDIDRDPGLGQLYDVNSYALAAAGKEAGAEVHRMGILAGENHRIAETLDTQLLRSEVLVITGAVGGEGSDRLRELLAELGPMEVNRVAMHPGSIVGFGTLGADNVPTFLLPANPSAALVAFEVLVRPLLQIIRGQRQATRRVVRARTIAAIDSAAQRRGFIRGQLMRDRETREFLVDPLGAVGGGEPTHLLGSYGQSNCLITIPPEETHVAPGQFVDVLFLSNKA